LKGGVLEGRRGRWGLGIIFWIDRWLLAFLYSDNIYRKNEPFSSSRSVCLL
jgi:hypothetical protein